MPDEFGEITPADKVSVNQHIRDGQTKAKPLKDGECPHKNLGKAEDVDADPPPVMVCLDCGQFWR